MPRPTKKSFSRSPYRIPKVAIIDPEILKSLPLKLTKESCIDIFSHLIEHYLSSPAQSDFADRMTEGMILCLKDNLAKVVNNLEDLEVRGQLALCASFGWSGLQALGRTGCIPMHSIEMPLSAYYDLPHARGMVVVIPPYLEYMADALPARWAQLARRCFGVNEQDDAVAAKLLSVKVVEWLKSVDYYLTLSDVGIPADKFEEMAADVVRMFPGPAPETTPGARPVTKADIVKMYELCK